MKPAETELYPPIKAFLEAQGYTVKGEIGGCDILARRAEEDPLIVEMKTGFSLALVFQGIDRQRVSDIVYLAVPGLGGKGGRRRYRDVTALCRRLGLGLILVRDGTVEVHLDPAPYRPRPDRARRGRLLREFASRSGDPATGGQTRRTIMTAYRQDALRVAARLADGPRKASAIAAETGIARTRAILYRNVYGWFERHGGGIYGLTPDGRAALAQNAAALPGLTDAA